MKQLLYSLRAAFYLVFCAVTVIPFALLALPMWLIPPVWRFRVLRWWPRTATIAAQYILGIRWQVIGQENLPANQGVIVLPKHQSTWETYFIAGFMQPYPVFVYKKELHFVPFFGWGIKSLNWIAIDRTKRAVAFEQVKQGGRRIVDEGRNLIMFPEGTRTKMGTKTIYKAGGTKLACALGATVMPMAHNAGALWARGAWLKTPGLITVSYGKPISAVDREPVELLAEVEAWIEAEVKRLSPSFY